MKRLWKPGMLITWKEPFLKSQRYMGHKGNFAIVISVKPSDDNIFRPALILYDDGLMFEVPVVSYQRDFYRIIG